MMILRRVIILKKKRRKRILNQTKDRHVTKFNCVLARGVRMGMGRMRTGDRGNGGLL